MNAAGVMYEGIIQDQNGDYYLLNPEHNGTYGMMLTTNGFTYNGVTYLFNQNHDGAYGKILNVGDIARSGLSVTQVNNDGKANYYTADFMAGSSSVVSQVAQQSTSTQSSASNALTQDDGWGLIGGFSSKYENATPGGLDSSHHDFLQNIYDNGVFG